MLLTIEPAFLTEVKKHLRVFHDEDNDLIENEIRVATNVIYTQHLLIPHKVEDPAGGLIANTEFPTTTNDFSENVKLAVKHLTTTFRTNPDERIESKYLPQTKRLIERILGSERNYMEEL